MQFNFLKEFTTLEEALANCPIGQVRPGISKEYVILLNETTVIKGPYRYNSNKIPSLKEKEKWLRYWETPLVLLPNRYFERQDGIYIEYPNLDDVEDMETEPWTESYTGRSYEVVKRKWLNKLNYVLPDEKWIYDLYTEDMLLALVHLWILNAGDVGLFNMLAQMKRREVHVIDFEQTRSKDRDDDLFYLSSRPAAKYRWLENVRPFYRKVADKVRPMLEDEANSSLFNRIEEAINRLDKYSDGAITTPMTGTNKMTNEHIVKIVAPPSTLNAVHPPKSASASLEISEKTFKPTFEKRVLKIRFTNVVKE